nr:MAG TPA: hypothetical protein [Caudoviricetes sp.]
MLSFGYRRGLALQAAMPPISKVQLACRGPYIL